LITRALIFASTLLLVILSLPHSSAAEQSGDSLNDRAINHFQQGCPDAAEYLLKRALTSIRRADREKLADIKYNLAAIYQDRHKYAEAEPLWRAALQSYLNSKPINYLAVADTRLNLGINLFRQNKQPEAKEQFESAAKAYKSPPNTVAGPVKECLWNAAYVAHLMNDSSSENATLQAIAGMQPQNVKLSPQGDPFASSKYDPSTDVISCDEPIADGLFPPLPRRLDLTQKHLTVRTQKSILQPMLIAQFGGDAFATGDTGTQIFPPIPKLSDGGRIARLPPYEIQLAMPKEGSYGPTEWIVMQSTTAEGVVESTCIKTLFDIAVEFGDLKLAQDCFSKLPETTADEYLKMTRLVQDPVLALTYARRAAISDPLSSEAKAAVDRQIRRNGMDPYLFDDRIAMGMELLSARDVDGARFEMHEASLICPRKDWTVNAFFLSGALAETDQNVRTASRDLGKAGMRAEALSLEQHSGIPAHGFHRLPQDKKSMAAAAFARAAIAMRLDRVPAAECLCREAIKLQPYSAHYNAALAYVLCRSGSHESRQFAELAVDLAPYDSNYMDLLNECIAYEPTFVGMKAGSLMREKRVGAAIGLVKRALERHPRNGWLWCDLGACYKKINRQQLASDAYKQAESDPLTAAIAASILRGEPSGIAGCAWNIKQRDLITLREVPSESVAKEDTEDPEAPSLERPNVPLTLGQPDVDFGPYMADLQRKIKQSWVFPKCDNSRRVVVVFKVRKDGELTNLRLDHSSGIALADKAALLAIEHAAPFQSLPVGAPNDIDIQYTFQCNDWSGRHHLTRDTPTSSQPGITGSQTETITVGEAPTTFVPGALSVPGSRSQLSGNGAPYARVDTGDEFLCGQCSSDTDELAHWIEVTEPERPKSFPPLPLCLDFADE
jgi:TonB family protein